MPDEFPYDVFFSHSAKDKRSMPPTLMHDTGGNAVVRPLAERLRADGAISKAEGKRPKAEIELQPSAFALQPFPPVLCMSAHAFGSDWAQLESGTFRFRDPLNKERRFLPLRLDDAPIKGSLAQFLYINWLPALREHEYEKLRD
ncbi:MAG: toll/interleukin-1 receptor domain-containing protein, partial [Chthoniobacteraceae bacterium]